MLKPAEVDSTEELYSAFFHELAHSSGSPKRLNRFDNDKATLHSREDYSKEELVAEITGGCRAGQCSSQGGCIKKVVTPADQ